MLHDGSCYIGQAEGLDNRLYGYRRPTQGVIGEYLLHHALIHAQGAKLEIFTKGDLTSKAERQRLEQVAIGYARTRYKKLLNGPRKDVDTLNAMIAFHTSEISRLQKRLMALSEGAPND